MAGMPRRGRCIIPGVACHVTQRGVDRQATFSVDDDRLTYLGLLRDNLADAQVCILAFCLMTDHAHVVAIPQEGTSLSILFRRLHGRYAQYYNARWGRTGHLWQNRFHACALGPEHLWRALAYVERNPVRAGMVREAAEYRWSSAAAHLSGAGGDGVLDMEWWRREGPADWAMRLRKRTRRGWRSCGVARTPASRLRARKGRRSGANASGGAGRPVVRGNSPSPQPRRKRTTSSNCFEAVLRKPSRINRGRDGHR